MAYSYTWNSLIDLAKQSVKGRPLDAVSVQYCDMVSNDMYIEYPWKETVTSTDTATGLTPLLDGYQDHSPEAVNIWRLLTCQIWNTTTTPFDIRDIDVRDSISTSLTPYSYTAIRVCSFQAGIGQIRLESAVRVPEGQNLELHYTFQVNPTKIVSLNQNLWFDDKYVSVALEGLLYHCFKLNDDPRAGNVTTDSYGRATGYTGQIGMYRAALNRMKSAEDFGAVEQLFPDTVMGAGRDVYNQLNVFNW